VKAHSPDQQKVAGRRLPGVLYTVHARWVLKTNVAFPLLRQGKPIVSWAFIPCIMRIQPALGLGHPRSNEAARNPDYRILS
jgi:hypothetical protein